MSGSDDTPTTKVGRLIEIYELDGFGAELEAYWTGEGAERKSLRDLATLFNEELLRTQMRDHGMSAVDSDVESYYELLDDDEVSAGRATEARRDLEQHGIDIDEVTDDFVTYQAIRGYLQNVRGASYEQTEDSEQIAKEQERLERLITRTEAVSREKLERLRDTDRIDLGTFRMFVGVNVFCESCGSQYSIEELLDEGGCDCG
ncbi:rod-determining factor RdfA [Haloarcula nitratireducens]|uniref:Uncharacterized protein n=1 Tax=Haloarcula nitratireducens TaxID=2487749 RepID=A0AAW4PGI2_9EURY|nr:rod-determining factor RdfA [Halomicroarcula nitratireducens]MBX0297008.1 hypothetical protein [Halomicroarcula nitratireducens]